MSFRFSLMPRRLCYYTGTVLCLALEQLGLPLRNEFTGATLYEQNCPTETLCADAPEEAALTALFTEHIQKQQALIEAHRQAHAFIPCEAAICGYDPMNMFRVGQQLYCSHFLFIHRGKPPAGWMARCWRSSPPGSDHHITGYC